jgi:undecaprenyl-diphosphatase
VPLIQAIILGIVQGLTEFLPISSSGHLLLLPWGLGWEELESASLKKSFDVALHLGTLIAVVGYFRRDLIRYVLAGAQCVRQARRPKETDEHLALLLVVATIPAVLVGLVLESFIEEALGTPLVIAVSLIGFGLLLWWADRSTGVRVVEELRLRDALIIGLAQTLALNPGTSRSGITMTAARRVGFGRDAAARISFLMSVPITAGAVAYKLAQLASEGVPEGFLQPMIWGIVTSAIAGWLAVWGTIRLVRTHTFAVFVIYRMALGSLVLVVIATGLR